jgi:hypothetical protein
VVRELALAVRGRTARPGALGRCRAVREVEVLIRHVALFLGIVLDGVLGDAERSLLEQLGDHDREHLDVAHLLRPDPVDEVAVLPRYVHVPRLELVLERNRDLAVLTAQHLLQLPRIHGIRGIRCRLVLQLLSMEEHLHSFVFGRSTAGRPSVARERRS